LIVDEGSTVLTVDGCAVAGFKLGLLSAKPEGFEQLYFIGAHRLMYWLMNTHEDPAQQDWSTGYVCPWPAHQLSRWKGRSLHRLYDTNTIFTLVSVLPPHMADDGLAQVVYGDMQAD